MRLRLLALAMFVVGLCFAQSPRQPKGKPNDDLRGTNKSPIVVQVLPAPKTQQEAAEEQESRQDQSSANWWMVKLTVAIVFIAAMQTVVFGLQARRLKHTIDKMDEIAEGQTGDMRASIAEATRAATAMEGVAASMERSSEAVQRSVLISREIADVQKLIIELQSRAYLTILFEGMVPQNHANNIRFEPRVRLVNRGNTPAKNVRFTVLADVVPFPLRDEFAFALPAIALGHSSVIGPGMHKTLAAVVP